MTATCWPRVCLTLAIGLLATGCTEVFRNGSPSTVIYSTPFGSTQVNPGDQTSPGSAPPPPGLGLNGPAPAARINLDGVYSGVAVPLDTGGGLCINNRTVKDFRVRGKTGRWGRFRGTIENNGLQMVFGDTWVLGQFVGDRFEGQITTSGRFGALGCSYMMTLRKNGA